MSDDNLDKLFVDAAEKHEPEFNSANWEKMSALLDNPTPTGTGGASSIVGWKGIASIITLAIVGSVFNYNQQSDLNPNSTELPVTVQSAQLSADGENNTSVTENSTNTEDIKQLSAEHNTKSEAAAQNDIENEDLSSTKTASDTNAGHKALDNQLAQNQIDEANISRIKELNVTNGLVKDGSGSRDGIKTKVQGDDSGDVSTNYVQSSANNAKGEAEPSPASNTGQKVIAADKSQPIIFDYSLQSSVATKNAQQNSEDAGKTTPSKVTQPQEGDVSVIMADEKNQSDKIGNTNNIDTQRSPAQLPIVTPEVLNQEEEVLANEEQREEVETTQEIKDVEDFRAVFPRGFSIKVGVSPDFSSINFKPSSGMGVNVGILGEYQFANRWSISAGLIMSKKIYSGEDVEYLAPNSQVYIADDMKGGCTVMDIPINISYSFGNPARTSYFVTTGLSSYMMMSENYTWSYDNGLQFEETASHENNDWFKQLNISVGIQRRLTDHFYVQLEPFIKAPLAGVGEGKVSLTSLGAFINVRYSFAK